MIQLNEYYIKEPQLSKIAELLESRGFIVGVFKEKDLYHEREPNKYSAHDFNPYADEETQLKKAIREVINQSTN